MNVFNIIGPVMIGPSSSHTAGACRIGRVVNKLAGGQKISDVKIILSGSFARTGKGHGTRLAILAGIMGYHSYSEEIRRAEEIARSRGIHFEFQNEDIPDAHPNTTRIFYRLENGYKGFVEGASIGGGNIKITRIDGMDVNFTGESNTLLVLHKDTPGVIANVTNLMYFNYSSLNICNFSLSRREKGGEALMTIEIDQVPPDQLITDLSRVENVKNAIMIRAV